mgnify:CR=1 FL=1
MVDLGVGYAQFVVEAMDRGARVIMPGDGIGNEVVPEGQALEAAIRWAGMILECSPKAVRASKQASYMGLDEQKLETAMRTVYPAQQENIESQDYIEGPKAFAEKRKPNWQNK